MTSHDAAVLSHNLKAFEGLVQSLESIKLFTEDLIDEGPYFFAIIDPDLRLLKLNQCAAQILGFRKTQQTAVRILDCPLRLATLGILKQHLENAFNDNVADGGFECEFELNGDLKYFQFQIQAIGDSLKANRKLMLLLGTDVTALKSLLNEQLRSKELEFAHRLLETQLTTTANIQKMLIPQKFASSGGDRSLKSRIVYRASEYCSGDFWWGCDYGDHYLLIICDVMGHGVPSGMVGSFINGFLQCHFNEKTRITEDFLKSLNVKLRNVTNCEYTTTFSAVQIVGDEVELWNVGGCYPYIIDRQENMSKVKMPSTMLGFDDLVMQTQKFSRKSLKRIIWHTDGFGDFRGPQNELFSRKKLAAIIDQVTKSDLEYVPQFINDQLNEIAKSYVLTDDITFAVVEL